MHSNDMTQLTDSVGTYLLKCLSSVILEYREVFIEMMVCSLWIKKSENLSKALTWDSLLITA